MLTAASSRATLLDWLQWNDPNGAWTDARARREFGEDFEPMDLDETWGEVARVVCES